ncbi:MAG: M48 family metallopeptidase [Clostridium sp.]|uniref:M48 family metallopeptidase n=1 Tax=Clostridium sp. TaxID=1506 RepID=UPI003F30877B
MVDFKEKVTISKKRMKNISIRIRDGKILVSAPLGISDEYIFDLLEKKRIWIEEKLKVKSEFKVNELLKREKIEDGEKVNYLGKEYNIKIEERSNGGIEFAEEDLIINCYKKENALEILKKFYIDSINRILIEKLNEMKEYTGLIPRRMTIKFMTTRWGSCNKAKGFVNLNGELITKREKAIEYVIIHELCHLIHPNHSREFYSLVEKYMKDYREEEVYLNGR